MHACDCCAGSSTLVGVTLQNLTQGQDTVKGGDITAQGDANQEDTDNLVPLNWRDQMGCFHFELNTEQVIPGRSFWAHPKALGFGVR